MKRARLKKTIAFLVLSLVLVAFIGFVEKQNLYKTYQGSDINIEGVSGVYFVDENEIKELLQAEFPELKAGLMLKEVRLEDIETRLAGHPFVKSVEAFMGQKGILSITVQQHQPIARIAKPMSGDGYVTTEGKVIPTSTSYTSRVLILEGIHAEELMQKGEISKEMPELMDLIRFINGDEFWSAQITELEVNSRSDIKLYQQVGHQIIEFGDAHDVESKFERIEIFYKEIQPRKGWNAYNKVSVKFRDQIVCE